MPLADGCRILGAEHLQEPLHRAGVDVGHLHATVPKGQHALLPCRELHHCGDRHRQATAAGRWLLPSGWHGPLLTSHAHEGRLGPAQSRCGTDGPLSRVSLPSVAELAVPARSSVSWHMISSTCASRSSLSRAYISRHRRGPKVPSFCKAWPNRGPHHPHHSLHAAARQPSRGDPQPTPGLPSPGRFLPPCPGPCPHQQQEVAVVQVKHQGLIQELVASAHGVGAGLGATAHAGVICPCLAGAGGPAATPASASPPASQGETKAVGQCRKPGPGPSPSTAAMLGRVSVGPTVSWHQGWVKEQVSGTQGTGAASQPSPHGEMRDSIVPPEGPDPAAS